MHPRVEYEITQWKPRALKRAKSLEGRPLTPVEQEVADNETDRGWDYFMVFGVQPETQKYIDHTIRMLERELDEPEHPGSWLVTSVRLQWSCKDVYNHITN